MDQPPKPPPLDIAGCAVWHLEWSRTAATPRTLAGLKELNETRRRFGQPVEPLADFEAYGRRPPDYEAVAACAVDWEARGGTQEELETAYKGFGVDLLTGRTGVWGGVKLADRLALCEMHRIRIQREAEVKPAQPSEDKGPDEAGYVNWLPEFSILSSEGWPRRPKPGKPAG